ncbi:hypothetical protein FZ934_24325 (plasmid) [Rhizobium grahamii]|uniref:Uncharacterized protein n=1 Tax=Rhizobium grahamii TaxID=1120045 RepID=A0A5Q0CGX2_9HYPH|nr:MULTISPECIES: DUF6790 family protein [Rhizobium]QFY63397.1 hypothetical protein FZ934_24325 [Rhizobium grahamii]QRM51838.1 hypothetical protein F3Y33_21320 [Rhizobium sp. BG6]
MIAQSIRFILTNLPMLLFAAATACATCSRSPEHWSRRYLSWLLLLAVGVDGIWAGIFHVFFPAIASAQIGWQPSPFEYEIGIADISLGVVAVASFWRSLSFQSAIASYAIIFYAGVTIGHFIQAFAHGDFAADNFGVLLVVTIARAIGLAIILKISWSQPSLRGVGGSIDACS